MQVTRDARGRRVVSYRSRERSIKWGSRRFDASGRGELLNVKPGKILSLTGRLRQGIVPRVTEKTASVVASNREARAYGRVHQRGNEENRFYNTPRGARAPIPARPFMPMKWIGGKWEPAFSAELRAEILEMIRKWLLNAHRRAGGRVTGG